MAQIYGELIRAQLQVSASDLTPTATGLVYFNATTGLKWYTGSAWKVGADLDSTQTFAGKTLDATCSINAGALPITTLAKGGLGADASAWSGFVKISAGVASAASLSASDLPLVTPSKGGTGVANNDLATLTRSGNHALTLTTTATTSLTLPTTGTVAVLTDITASNLSGVLATSKGGTGQNSTATFPTSGTVATTADITAANLSGILASTKGGTGVNNAGTLTYGANNITLTTSGVTGVTLPASGTLATLAGTEALTNKDIDGATASNTSRITLPKASKSVLDGLTRKQATLVYGSDTNKVYADDGSTLKEIGSGSSGINYLSAQYGADALGTVQTSVGDVLASSTRSNPTQWGNSAASALITQSTDSTLRGTTNYLVAYTANAQFVESPLFSIDGEDLGKPLLVQFDVSGVGTADDVQVYVARYNSSNVLQERILVAGTASATTPNSAQVPTGVTTFKGFFIPSSTATDKYAIRWLRNANNTSMRLDTFFVGPQSLAQGAVVTGWQSYTPTFESGISFGSTGTSAFSWRRVGTNINIVGTFKTGGTGINLNGTSGLFTFSLPPNLTISTTVPAINGYVNYGFAHVYNNVNDLCLARVSQNASSTTRLLISIPSTSTTGTVVNMTTALMPSGSQCWFEANVPVSEWSSGTTTLADRAVEEYAYNTGSWSSNDFTSFANGPSGQVFPSGAGADLTTQVTKRIRFQTPILATDKIEIEIKTNNAWMPLSGSVTPTNQYGFSTFLYNTTVSSGSVGIGWTPVSGSTTDIDIIFGRWFTQNGNATTTSWGTAIAAADANKIFWRVKKISGGAAVGFPVSARNIVGDTTGSVVPSGYIGQILTSSGTNTGQASGLQTTNLGTGITLTPGIWTVEAYGIGFNIAPTYIFCTVTDSANAGINDSNGFAWTGSNSNPGAAGGRLLRVSTGRYYFRVAEGSTLVLKAQVQVDFPSANGSTTVLIQGIRIA